MSIEGHGARGRSDAIGGNQLDSGCQPSDLTDANPPSPDGAVSNLSGLIPRSGIEPPADHSQPLIEYRDGTWRARGIGVMFLFPVIVAGAALALFAYAVFALAWIALWPLWKVAEMGRRLGRRA